MGTRSCLAGFPVPPLPRHIVKQILAANSASMQAVPPWLQEMDDRAIAAIEARRAAKKVKKGEDTP